MSDAENLRSTGNRIEALLDEFERVGDPRVSAWAEELVRLLTDMYGEALARVLAAASEPDAPRGEDFVRSLCADALLSSLMVLHDLHPDETEARVRRALDHISAALGSGDVRLLELDEAAGSARIRLLAPNGTARSAAEELVRRAMQVAAPDIVVLDLDTPLPATPVQLGSRPRVAEPSR
jgi:hypothetical protein